MHKITMNHHHHHHHHFILLKNKNIIFNNKIEIQLAGGQKNVKVHEAGAHIIHSTKSSHAHIYFYYYHYYHHHHHHHHHCY